MIMVKTQHGYLEYVRPKSTINRKHAEEIAQIERVMDYINNYPAKDSSHDDDLLKWLATQPNVRTIHA